MLKRVVLLIGFLSLFTSYNAQERTVTYPAKQEVVSGEDLSEKQTLQKEIREDINHHLLDTHSFDILKFKDGSHLGFPLPVFFYDQENGFHSMMGSAFHGGEHTVESKGSFYALSHEKIVKTDAEGTIHHDDKGLTTNERVLDLSITKGVLMIIITALLMIWLFSSMARGYKRSQVPSGAARFLEPVILFIRDDIAIPNIGPKYKKYMSYLLTVFFFILFLNIFGLMPFGINVTGNIAITFALALVTFIITQVTANGSYWKHIFWMPGVPVPMKIIMMPIEILGMFIKPFALLIRLFANMSAGHIIVMSLIGLIYVFQNIIAGVAFPFLTFVIFLLEVLVAFLQAYIFTMLTAVYFGMGNEEHQHEEAH